MTRIVSLVSLPPGDIERIKAVAGAIDFVDAGGWFDGEYASTWPAATARRYVSGQGQGSAAERDAILSDAEVVIAGFPFPLDLKARAPGLRWLHQTPAGASNLMRGDIWGSDTLVTTSRGLGETTAIAEYVMAAAMYFAKGFFRAAVDRDNGEFDHRAYKARAVETRNLCVIGAGGIGREVARLAKSLGMSVSGTRRDLTPKPGDEYFDVLAPPGALHEQLANADFVAVCCQWTPETTDLLDDAAFAAMRDGAVVINVARGEIIDQAALARSLAAGKLRGAALDVYVGEFDRTPPEELWRDPRVLITPHTSGQTDASRRRSTELFLENLQRYLAGDPLSNVVDWRVGY